MKFPSQKMKQLSTALVLPWLVGLMVVLYAQVVVAQSGVASGDAVVAVGPDTGWKTYRHDNRRSGVTSSSLDFPLTSRWIHRSPLPPQMAWTGPAKWDAYSGNSGLQSMRNFDPCFYVTSDGESVFFGSSADDAIHSLDLKTGKEKWVHFTGAAVRLPPTIANGNLYFGSDDGYAYCCDKASGERIWRTRASNGNRHITSNRKLMSLWPVRTGVLVDGKQAVFAGSLVPWEKSYLCSVDALSGGVESEQGFRRELANVTLQGALLASSKKLFVPQGRAAPLAFDRKDGTPRGKIGEAGGVFCILSEDDMLFAGPPHQKERDDQIRVADLDSNASVASFTGTNRILVAADLAWLATDGKLKCLDRSQNVQAQDKMRKIQNDLKKKTVTAEQAKPLLQEAQKQLKDAWQWEVESDVPFDMVKAGDAVIVGLNGSVRAYSAVDGKLLWQESLAGTAHGLAIVAGMLIVSTDLGHIHAFATVQ